MQRAKEAEANLSSMARAAKFEEFAEAFFDAFSEAFGGLERSEINPHLARALYHMLRGETLELEEQLKLAEEYEWKRLLWSSERKSNIYKALGEAHAKHDEDLFEEV